MRYLIGLGGNLGDVTAAFAAAHASLARHGEVIGVSSLWRSEPLGPEQDDFLNAAAVLATPLDPVSLLAACHEIEARAGRDRSAEPRWGPRRLDLDLLLADAVVVVAPELCLPHPRLAERRFALAPSAEVAPDWEHPRLHRTVADLAATPEVLAQQCARIGAFPRD